MEKLSKKTEGILNSSEAKRYKYFIHTVADNLEMWGYYNEENNAWMTKEKNGVEYILLFPEKVFTQLFEMGNSIEWKPKAINVYEFLYEWRNCMQEQKITLYGGTAACIRSPEDLIMDLAEELSNY